MKRLPREWNFELVAVKPAVRGKEAKPAANFQESGRKLGMAAMQAEAHAIRAAESGFRRVILDEQGKPSTSRELAARIERWLHDGRDTALIIGGADGLDAEFKRTADETLSLSQMTLPHGIARVLLLEQLYRASSVMKGHPYHRD